MINYGKYFKKKDFDCKCGCGLNNINQELVDNLNTLRELLKEPIIINSACRCLKHNKNIGSSDTSTHLKGLAVDISAKNSNYRYKLLKVILFFGIKRVGIEKDFIHIDIDKEKFQDLIFLYGA